jgi:hypothetical protein
MKFMVQELRAGRAPVNVMKVMKAPIGQVNNSC